jgi:hypothetical protein
MNQESRKTRKRVRKKFLLSCFPDSLFLILLPCVIAGCKREERGFRVGPPTTEKMSVATMSDLHPGGGPTPAGTKNGYEESAYAISEGQKLYMSMNCVGCHFHGGGGIGPPLMDNEWIYGSDPQQIFASIVEGRPNGMPARFPITRSGKSSPTCGALAASRRAAPRPAAAMKCKALIRQIPGRHRLRRTQRCRNRRSIHDVEDSLPRPWL